MVRENQHFNNSVRSHVSQVVSGNPERLVLSSDFTTSPEDTKKADEDAIGLPYGESQDSRRVKPVRSVFRRYSRDVRAYAQGLRGFPAYESSKQRHNSATPVCVLTERRELASKERGSVVYNWNPCNLHRSRQSCRRMFWLEPKRCSTEA